MRFIFVSDLHSNKAHFIELERLIYLNKPDILIIGGDIFAYSSKAEPQLEFAKEYLSQFIIKINIPIYIIPGNCDKPQAINYLKRICSDGALKFLTLEGEKLNNIEFIGYNYTPPNPFKIKDWERKDLKEDYIVLEGTCLLSNSSDKLNIVANDFLNYLPSIEEDLSQLNNKKSIWVMHAPPFGGILDKNYANACAGSKGIRKSIERVQPILTLHGHIHEAPYMSNKWSERIGNTISINPGSGELLHAVICEIDEEGNIAYIKHSIFGELAMDK
jgi:Icc-related predicted phosphoesterase